MESAVDLRGADSETSRYTDDGCKYSDAVKEEKEPYSAPGKNGEVQLYAAVIEKGHGD